MNVAELQHRFTYHPPPDEETGNLHEEIREACFVLAQIVNDRIEDSREKSVAITKIEEAMMWANAGIARQHETES